MNGSTRDKYTYQINKAKENLTQLDNLLIKHHDHFEGQGYRHWGYIGDIIYINEQLENIIEFMSSGKPIPRSVLLQREVTNEPKHN